MENIGLNQLREMFLSFFESKGHYRLKSYPLVPQNDNSLLLINSGMAPLKPFFTGEIEPPSKRATSCQKCIRTPDIENVGKDARHGTYFEMLGNFSFGDYFKHEICAWAWEFITEVLKMPKDKLYISVFEDDDETWGIWEHEVGVDPSHLVRMGREDNFWEIGSGPCGPCSEIYFDRGEKYKCDNPNCSVGCDCDRFVEFWNLVFSQFSSDGKGNYAPLVKKNIDTGMGLERLACIMQDVESLFDVDTMHKIMAHVSRITGVKYGANKKTDVSMRIITDHIRSATMMVCDGILPSNAGRGYVMRRLLRRACRHGRLLGVTTPFLYKVCETVIAENEAAYPELREKEKFIKSVIKTEEQRFCETIEAGLVKLDILAEDLRKNNKTQLSGEEAFKLYDTDGFPIDLTIEILEEQGLTVDRAEFDKNMQEQRLRAKNARGNNAKLAWESDDVSLRDIPKTKFLGYNSCTAKGKIIAIIHENQMCDQAMEDDKITLITDQTAFYAESGGQVADVGTISNDAGVLEVTAVSKTPDGKFLHSCTVKSGMITLGETVEMHVDTRRRAAISRAHSATHLLQKALRRILGDHIEQSGSLVEPDRLRFDFSHFAALSEDDICSVESEVNRAILEGYPITVDEMPIAEAKKMGAMALFGEKYGDIVRVVKMGDYSVELCGGVHLNNTARVGSFKITSETSVAAGVRRIEAVCGMQTILLMRSMDECLMTASKTLKTTPSNLAEKVLQTLANMHETAKTNEKLAAKLARLKAIELFNFTKAVGDVNVLAVKVDETDTEALRNLSDSIRDKAPNMVCVLGMVLPNGQVSLAAACGKEAINKGAHAGKIIKAVAQMLGGGGGGRPDSATAGGKDGNKLEAALEAVNNIVSEMMVKK